MFKMMAIVYVGSISMFGAQAFASSGSNVRPRVSTSSPSYYCGILQAYGQVDLKECGPYQFRKTNLKR